MSLKILVFPIFIVLILTLVIGYIKPDVSEVLAKRKEIAEKQAALARVDSVIANIRSQNASIAQRKDSEALVLKYLPLTLEEERVLDTFNYLASQSGVIIIGLSVEENVPQVEEIPQVNYASSSFQLVTNAGVVGDASLSEPPKKITNSYNSSVTVVGPYANIKDFFGRLNRADRFHETLSFSIQERKKEEGGTEEEEAKKLPDDFLEAKFSGKFIHFKPSKVYSVLDQPLFQQSQFDFSTIDDLLNHIKSPLPPLEVPSTGKLNPFE